MEIISNTSINEQMSRVTYHSDKSGFFLFVISVLYIAYTMSLFFYFG